jgi:hypothetical protein
LDATSTFWDFEFKAYVLTGLLLAQFASLATWLTLGTLALRNRVVIAGTIAVTLSLTLVIGLQIWPGMPFAAALLMLISGLGLTFFTAGTVALVIQARQLHLVDHSGVSRPLNPSRKQFGVGYLLVLMAAVALFITLFRAAIPKDVSPWLGPYEYVSLFFWFLMLACSMGLFSCIACSLLLRKPSALSVIVFLASIALGPLGFQFAASGILTGRFATNWQNGKHLLLAYSVFGGLCVGLSLVLAIVRWLGFRLAPINTDGKSIL